MMICYDKTLSVWMTSYTTDKMLKLSEILILYWAPLLPEAKSNDGGLCNVTYFFLDVVGGPGS